MSGYLVIPRQVLTVHGGPVPAAPMSIALFDFLREIEQEPFPFSPRAQLCLTGLDELLISLGCTDQRAGVKELELLQGFKRRLRDKAVEISTLADIQVPVAFDLVLGGGNELSTRHTARELVPLWRLFGHNPTIRELVPGRIGYHFGENLS
jgi:hypothetical protein